MGGAQALVVCRFASSNLNIALEKELLLCRTETVLVAIPARRGGKDANLGLLGLEAARDDVLGLAAGAGCGRGAAGRGLGGGAAGEGDDGEGQGELHFCVGVVVVVI